MKIEWLVADVTAVGSLDTPKCAVLGGDRDWVCFWPIKVIFVVREPLCGVGPPLEL